MKLRLDIDDLTDDFFEDTCLIGIVSAMKDYQFCWHLNHLLHFDFRLNHDIEIQLNKKQRQYFFSVFEYSEQATALTHYLYNNEFDGEYLLPEFKHLDFLWLLKGDATDLQTRQELMTTIRSVNGVQLVTELRHEQIRHKAHLIF